MAAAKTTSRQLIAAFFLIAASLILAWLLAPEFHSNKDAREVLVTVFSVLAGVLVALMTMSADARRLGGQSKRESVWFFQQMRREINAQKVIFWIYLSVLVLLFLDAVHVFSKLALTLVSDYLIVWLSLVSIISSFILPSELTRRQVDALTEEIRARK